MALLSHITIAVLAAIVFSEEGLQTEDSLEETCSASGGTTCSQPDALSLLQLKLAIVPEVSVAETKAVPKQSKSIEGGFGDEPGKKEGITQATSLSGEAKAMQALMQTGGALLQNDLREVSDASVKELDDLEAASRKLYTSINSKVSPSLQDFRRRTPEMIHSLNYKGQMHYAHMHVASHNPNIVGKHSDPILSVASFALKLSMFSDDRVILTLLCFTLIAMSTLLSFYKTGDKKALISSDPHGTADTTSEKLSLWDGTVTTFSSILGMGFLSLPYAMSQAGWVAVPLIVFFTACSGYTAHLLSWALQRELENARSEGRKVLPGWGFLVGVAYGKKAERLINIFLIVELWGYVLSGIVAIALNLNQMADEISITSCIALTVLVQFVLSTLPGKALTRINVVSNVLFIACILMFVLTGLLLPARAPASELKFVHPGGLLAASGIIVFSPASHSIYPSIVQRMEKPEEFPTCIKRAYGLAAVAYVSLAVAGYYLFGNSCQPSVVKNIGADLHLVPLPNLGWMNTVAAVCMVVKLSGFQPLLLNPLNSTIMDMMQGLAPRSIAETLVPPAVLTVSAAVAVHFAQQMAILLSIIGSIFCATIAFVMPVLCYRKLSSQQFGGMQHAVFTGLIVMGSAFAILGFITALAS